MKTISAMTHEAALYALYHRQAEIKQVIRMDAEEGQPTSAYWLLQLHRVEAAIAELEHA